MDQRKQSTLLSLCYEYSGDDINLEEKEWNEAKHLVKIFDNYATQYAEWCCARAIGTDNFKLNEEELSQFKKEKGL